jgi:hypothetical protein
MSDDEIFRLQERDRVFRATPLGAAFTKFERTHAHAWQSESVWLRSDKRLREIWDASDKARQEFLDLLSAASAPSPQKPESGK